MLLTFKRDRSPAEEPLTELAATVAEARDEIGRTDVKAGTLLTLATGALAGLLTFAHAGAPVAAAVMLWAAAALVTAALAVLLAVVRPHLDGVPRNGIFPSSERLLEERSRTDLRAWQADRLRILGKLAVVKHRRVRLAVDLLLAALAVLALAAVLDAARI